MSRETEDLIKKYVTDEEEEYNNTGSTKAFNGDNERPAVNNKILGILEPVLEHSLTEGTKRQKQSILQLWWLFCERYDVDGDTFGRKFKEGEDTYPAVWNEVHKLAGFASFVVKFPRKKRKENNSTEHTERAVSAMC